MYSRKHRVERFTKPFDRIILLLGLALSHELFLSSPHPTKQKPPRLALFIFYFGLQVHVYLTFISLSLEPLPYRIQLTPMSCFNPLKHIHAIGASAPLPTLSNTLDLRSFFLNEFFHLYIVASYRRIWEQEMMTLSSSLNFRKG